VDQLGPPTARHHRAHALRGKGGGHQRCRSTGAGAEQPQRRIRNIGGNSQKIHSFCDAAAQQFHVEQVAGISRLGFSQQMEQQGAESARPQNGSHKLVSQVVAAAAAAMRKDNDCSRIWRQFQCGEQSFGSDADPIPGLSMKAVACV
jgi:hypothetical protein